jgi:hypothetical protein
MVRMVVYYSITPYRCSLSSQCASSPCYVTNVMDAPGRIRRAPATVQHTDIHTRALIIEKIRALMHTSTVILTMIENVLHSIFIHGGTHWYKLYGNSKLIC